MLAPVLFSQAVERWWPEEDLPLKLPRVWASAGICCAGFRGCSSLVRGDPSVLVPRAPKASPGPTAEGYMVEFLSWWDREVGLGITPPLSPQCFRIQGQDPQDRVKWSEAQFSCEQQEAQLLTIANPLEQGRASPWGAPSVL